MTVFEWSASAMSGLGGAVIIPLKRQTLINIVIGVRRRRHALGMHYAIQLLLD